MTASDQENATAANAQSKGESAARQHEQAAEAQHRTTTGSDVAVEDAPTGDDIAVSWSTTDNAAAPSLNPSEPRPVEQRQHDGPPAA